MLDRFAAFTDPHFSLIVYNSFFPSFIDATTSLVHKKFRPARKGAAGR